MQDDAERFEIVDRVTEQKEIIKKASQGILSKINEPHASHNVDADILEILTAVSIIGTITDNSKRFTDFGNDWGSLMGYALTQDLRLRRLFVRDILYTICSISFIVKKQRERYTIDLPKNVLSIFMAWSKHGKQASIG